MDEFNKLELKANGPLTVSFKNLKCYTFKEACLYVKQLPYQRISDSSNLNLVLQEQCGTCSSKHGLLKALAIENNYDFINLYIGIYKMNALNTKGIGAILEDYNLKYIPEAHTYFKIGSSIIDITGLENSAHNFYDNLLKEVYILPDQVGTYKKLMHQAFIKEWITKESIPYNFNTIWSIREQCILSLTA